VHISPKKLTQYSKIPHIREVNYCIETDFFRNGNLVILFKIYHKGAGYGKKPVEYI